MRWSSLCITLSILLALLTISAPSARAWQQSDFEIFDLVDELEQSEGKDVNFYSWLNVQPSASSTDINRAYRKLSLKLHPDKNKKDAQAKERFARLGKIVGILRDGAKRERYDHFYKNGVPRWRGTGYYYSRFRPGLGFVVVFLIGLSGAMQYIVGWVNYYLEKKRIVGFVQDARAALTQNVPKSQGAPTMGRSYVEVGGRVLRCEVKSDEYIIIYPTKDEEPVHLNTEWITKPTVTNNVYFIRWIAGVFYKVTGKPMPTAKEMDESPETSDQEQEQQQDGTTKSKKKAKKGKPVAVTGSKVGGRRRAVKPQN
ncbi:DnaJ domain-containing protein [Zychaea mexicana]|uniref:DnaJ domain-containing protein n=1 Tax=Zychaea mexicana TaxID=64656 RepID=UPI0022FED1B3|nr:DnaJ domain-containing protein [Zychaea mexicana]KAI9493602.1 DnaJ domain-containing protein [Zychaea mexicana]